MNFVKHCIENGGSIRHLLISSKDLKGPSLNNPSIYLDRVTPPLSQQKKALMSL